MIITHGSKCDARWTGTTVEHCAACHLTFGSTRAGDAHRVGEHGVREGPDRRRCLTVEEMRAKTIGSGAMKGEPWFRVTVNVFGTEIWTVNKARDTRWDIPHDAQNRRTGDSGTPGPERGPEPSELNLGEAA